MLKYARLLLLLLFPILSVGSAGGEIVDDCEPRIFNVSTITGPETLLVNQVKDYSFTFEVSCGTCTTKSEGELSVTTPCEAKPDANFTQGALSPAGITIMQPQMLDLGRGEWKATVKIMGGPTDSATTVDLNGEIDLVCSSPTGCFAQAVPGTEGIDDRTDKKEIDVRLISSPDGSSFSFTA